MNRYNELREHGTDEMRGRIHTGGIKKAAEFWAAKAVARDSSVDSLALVEGALLAAYDAGRLAGIEQTRSVEEYLG